MTLLGEHVVIVRELDRREADPQNIPDLGWHRKMKIGRLTAFRRIAKSRINIDYMELNIVRPELEGYVH
jgi:hypothetical protein